MNNKIYKPVLHQKSFQELTVDELYELLRVRSEVLKEVSIGRVITTERGNGYGKQIMLYAIEVAKEHFGAKQIDLEAQEYAKGFYESVGFRQSSDTFMLDGIPHIKMTWTIDGVQ